MESEVGLQMSTNQTVVIIGGGIWGFSTAFHLAKLGVQNVIVIEQNALPAIETTPRAAGLVGQIRTSAVMCGLLRTLSLDLKCASVMVQFSVHAQLHLRHSRSG